MTGWNFADIWEAVADRFPEAPAQRLAGGSTTTWSEFDRRADGVARALLDAGLGRQDKVAQYLYNCPEYLESMFALFKAGLVPVNTNYRYTDDELSYLWNNADVVAVVFHGAFADRCERMRETMPQIREFLWVDDGSGECPPWATPYEQLASQGGGREHPSWGRSGADLYVLYTGGTTGYPKGVMWPQHDLFSMLESSSGRDPLEHPDAEAYAGALEKPGPRILPAAPLMHGTSAWVALNGMSRAGAVITSSHRTFDVAELLDTVARERINGLVIVGDVFAKPLVRALDDEPDRWDLSSLRVLFSGGAMLSAETKQRLVSHIPRLMISDNLGSSESGSLARSMTTGNNASVTTTAMFTPTPSTRVIDEEGREVIPGSGERGRIATTGYIPTGYYNDPVKTAATFVTVGETRFVVTGDWAEVDADGSIRLLGRGSECINTGGEKVYPEEVEEVLKSFAGIDDAIVVGVPDDRFGERVIALVQPEPGATLERDTLLRHAHQKLAGYKVPKAVLEVESIGRSPSGKADYPALREHALQRLAN